MIFRYLINLSIKIYYNFNIILEYLLFKIIDKKLNNKKIYLIIKTNFRFKIYTINIIKILYKRYDKTLIKFYRK